ncbi:MAG: putative DNA-binding domain-containing protein [Rhizobiales bacterium]|nr:putative DNA-binding domain-containing protein [Rhizobacter sp.]
MNLLAIQLGFQQHLLGAADATPLLAGSAERRALGLGVYANAYRQRLVDVLADTFAKTCSVLGEMAFEAAALQFIADHPPTHRNLREFGAGFAEHLRETLPAQPEVAELALLDCALRRAFDGPDSAVLGAADLAAVPPPAWAELTLTPVPTALLLRFAHNTVAVWQALDDDTAPPPRTRGTVAIDWLVWRKELQPHFRSLVPAEAALLQAMLAGASFAEACEQAAAAADDDITPLIGHCLRVWVDDGLLSAVSFPAG